MRKYIIIAIALLFLSAAGATFLSDLSDVSTIGASTGKALIYNGRGWAPSAIVNLTGLSNNQVLRIPLHSKDLII